MKDELYVEAKIENMNMVQDFICDRIKDCSVSIQNQIGLVIDEIFSNIANYAYNPTVGSALIRIAVLDDDITLEFEDDGIPYNPLETEDPDITLDLDERAIGGLGIFLVKDIMDYMEYRHEDNKNILTIRKRFKED
ncbi:MAG: ATP-binding protein [Oscillospiraceae bacterium]|nr:ATP-binding protein [Oscillospiraceae bacterium]